MNSISILIIRFVIIPFSIDNLLNNSITSKIFVVKLEELDLFFNGYCEEQRKRVEHYVKKGKPKRIEETSTFILQ